MRSFERKDSNFYAKVKMREKALIDEVFLA